MPEPRLDSPLAAPPPPVSPPESHIKLKVMTGLMGDFQRFLRQRFGDEKYFDKDTGLPRDEYLLEYAKPSGPKPGDTVPDIKSKPDKHAWPEQLFLPDYGEHRTLKPILLYGKGEGLAVQISTSTMAGSKPGEDGYIIKEYPNDRQMTHTVPNKGVISMVADGAGDKKAGGIMADAVMIETAKSIVRADFTVSDASVKSGFNEAANKNPNVRGGTTATLLHIVGDEYGIAHIGDSQASLYREGKLTQLTTDHDAFTKKVDQLVKGGMKRAEAIKWVKKQNQQAKQNNEDQPYGKNRLTRCIRGGKVDEVDTFSGRTKEGDVFVLASDALNKYLTSQEVSQLIQKHGDQKNLAQVISDLAYQRAMSMNFRRIDDLTVSILRIIPTPAQAS